MAKHELGRYQLEDDGTDLLVKDQNGNNIFRYDQSTDKMELLKTVKSVDTESVNGGLTGNTEITDVAGRGLEIQNNELQGANWIGTTSGSSLSLGGGYTIIDSNNPVFLKGLLEATTDGSTDAVVRAVVDESGGSSSDYTAARAEAVAALGSGGEDFAGFSGYLPAGASIAIQNIQDPSNSNQFFGARELIL